MSISRSHQHRAGFCALRVLSILGIAASLFALCRFASAEAPVITWAARVLADDAQPQWKRQFAQSAIDGDCVRFTARTTAYSDRDDLDPGTGGGIWGCTWIAPCGRKRPTPILKHGYVAADVSHWPTGTVLYAAPPFDRSWIVADCGPGVRGKSRIDVYCPDRSTWKHYQRYERTYGPRLAVWVLGRITRAQAGR